MVSPTLFYRLSPQHAERKHLPAPPASLLLTGCSRSLPLSLSLYSPHCAAAASYPAQADVRASNLSHIKAMQREFMLVCHRKKRGSGESFEQVDR